MTISGFMHCLLIIIDPLCADPLTDIDVIFIDFSAAPRDRNLTGAA
jgi:hypothetical protein